MRLNLKIAIVSSGRSQRELSRESQVAENRLSSIVRGWMDPRDDERRAIADALGQPVDDLFVLEERAARRPQAHAGVGLNVRAAGGGRLPQSRTQH